MTKYHHIYLDAIDKAGKNIVGKYIDQLGKHFYTISDRGIISNVTFSRMFNRGYEYDLEQYRDCVFVYLTVDKPDWLIRCKLTNEPKIDYELNRSQFDQTVKDFKDKDFRVLEFNTSELTPYQVAKQVIAYMENLNEQEQRIGEQ